METNGNKNSVYSNLAKVAMGESARPVKIKEKRMMFGIVRDITQKKKIEEALHRAIKEIESLVEERSDKEKGARGKSKNQQQSAKDTIDL